MTYSYRDMVFQVFQGHEVLQPSEYNTLQVRPRPDAWYWEWIPQQCDRATVFGVEFATKAQAIRDAKRLTDRLCEGCRTDVCAP